MFLTGVVMLEVSLLIGMELTSLLEDRSAFFGRLKCSSSLCFEVLAMKCFGCSQNLADWNDWLVVR